MENTMVITIRLNKALNKRLIDLAHKSLTNRNEWIVRHLSRDANYKPSELSHNVSSKE